MGALFNDGGTNSSTQNYNSSETINGHDAAGSTTLTNTSAGTLNINIPAGQQFFIAGSLENYGAIGFNASTVGAGNTFLLGGNSANTLINDGSIGYFTSFSTSGSSVYLAYGVINNESNGSIEFDAAGASTISAPNVTSLTNSGTITINDTSGSGMTANWGAGGTSTFTNTGTFSIDDSAGTSGSTTNLSFGTINNSGTVSFNLPAASTAITTVGSGGFTNSGTWSITSEGTGAGNIQITGGTNTYTNNGTINVSDANLTINNKITGTNGVFNLSNGAHVTLNGTNTGSGQTFNFSGGDNTLDITYGNSFTGIIRGFSQGDKLDLNVSGTPSYDATTGILTITSGSAPLFTTYTYDVGKGYTGTFSDNSGVVSYVGTTPCYLAGSMLRVVGGEKAVEEISIGDRIIAWDNENGVDVTKAVVWVGSKTVIVNASLPDDLAGYPIRVCKDAISDGVPYSDLLITAEHCLFLDGRFVPARMLVNGRSIFFDRSMQRFDVYHIETEVHSIVTANGMLSESFLNTENHGLFRKNSRVVSLSSTHQLTWDDAAAPLTVSRETIEPLFRTIEKRANKVGFAIQAEARPLTNESDLHLTTDTGAIIRPARQSNGRVMFMIPNGVESVRIVSNASRPCDVVGPFVDDRRNLGILVGEITLFESNRTRTLTDHLHDTQLSGWNNVEEDTMRWTNGNAMLPLGQRTPSAIALMALEVRAAGPYIRNETIFEHYALKA